ncbi:uncharacterized protein LOC142597553 [Dermatophagoides farinae]|uniref:uncharacterized protein LOC142597553 n=1 Tax=Dermatophagoides farinae TaxID=6954 RepID=UPI003F61AB82
MAYILGGEELNNFLRYVTLAEHPADLVVNTDHEHPITTFVVIERRNFCINIKNPLLKYFNMDNRIMDSHCRLLNECPISSSNDNVGDKTKEKEQNNDNKKIEQHHHNQYYYNTNNEKVPKFSNYKQDNNDVFNQRKKHFHHHHHHHHHHHYQNIRFYVRRGMA